MEGRILIVDDETPNLDLLGRMLRKGPDLVVDVESSSSLALEKALATEYDVVVTDIVMPDPDGLEILRRVKERWPDTEVVMLSGLMNVDRALESLKLHAFDFVPKPVEVQKFRSTLTHALEHRRLVLDNTRMTEELRAHARALQDRVDEATGELTAKVAELDALSANLRAVLDNIPSGCVVVRPGGQIFQINGTAAAILGLDDPSAARGGPLPTSFRLDPLLDFIHGAGPGDRRRIRLPSIDGQEPTLLEAARSRVTTAYDEFVVVVMDDVTERDDLERRMRHQERLATVGGLAAGIAHEIKNPLGAIRGLGELLSMKIEAVVTLKKFSDNIMGEVDRLTKIINDISRFSREVTPTRQEVALGHLLEELTQAYRDRPERRTVTLTVEDGLPDLPYDYVHLRQALEAVLDNAMGATADGGSIALDARREGDAVLISIRDDGVGIPEESLDKIFKPFYSTRKAKGSGLGLTIAEKVVTDHGGTIRVSSREGAGTTVVVRLPVTAGAAEEEELVTHGTEAGGPLHD